VRGTAASTSWALVGIEQISQAADNLAGVAVRTPLLPQLSADADRPL
jgi:hypothetical protein